MAEHPSAVNEHWLLAGRKRSRKDTIPETSLVVSVQELGTLDSQKLNPRSRLWEALSFRLLAFRLRCESSCAALHLH